MRMHNPPHPGLTVTEAARALDVSRKTLSSILNGRAGISAGRQAVCSLTPDPECL
jgi:plasmid maintenance system antidote protein VapI